MPHKRVSKHVEHRIDHKKERAAVRQVLDGGHHHQPQLQNWSSPSTPIPVIDDTMPHRSAPKTGCPKNHGGDHLMIKNPKRHFHQSGDHYGWWVGPAYVCQHCHKPMYRRTGSWLVRTTNDLLGFEA